ncbi:MAG: aminoacyl-tRNA hydrolase [Ferruginibacter sp.]
MSKFLIAGLGNVGNEYAGTRHNIGFDVVNAFVHAHEGSFTNERLAYRAEVKWKGKIFVCICPTTFMNLSGRAVKYWLDKEKIPVTNSLTVVDDLALPLTKLRLRATGSHAGHNGLKDIEAILGNDAYPKLRFGIGSQFSRGMQVEFVLGKWEKKEMDVVQEKITACIKVIEDFATLGLPHTMTAVNAMSF